MATKHRTGDSMILRHANGRTATGAVTFEQDVSLNEVGKPINDVTALGVQTTVLVDPEHGPSHTVSVVPLPDLDGVLITLSDDSTIEHRFDQRQYWIPIQVSDELVLDGIIEGAGYGINYWVLAAEIDEAARTYTLTLTSEAASYLHLGEGRRVVLSYDQLAAALVAIATRRVEIADYLHGYAWSALRDNDGSDIDAVVGDVIVQVAVFGEVVFG